MDNRRLLNDVDHRSKQASEEILKKAAGLEGSVGSKLMSTSPDQISADLPDWTREEPRGFWDPGRKLLGTIRGYQRWRQRTGPVALLARKIYVFRHRVWSVITGADIPLNCQIGGGLLLPHPNGIVIHPEARVGVNCLIFHQVTIGARNRSGLPIIGGHVDIGAGAKVLGPIKIGDHAAIGANAVVTRDVKAGETVIGFGTAGDQATPSG